MSKKREKKAATNRYADLARPQSSLDFHGTGPISSQEVKHRTIAFVEAARKKKQTKIAIITGKGLHSKGRPLVKPQVERTLRELQDQGLIRLYYTEKVTAGGDGAVIVEL